MDRKQFDNKSNAHTHITLVLDASASMVCLQNSLIRGVQAFIDEQMLVPGKLTLSQWTFGDDVRRDFSHVLAQEAPKVADTYYIRGFTRLIDACCLAIKDTLSTSADNVIVLVFTDGHENASREYRQDTLREMIRTQEKEGWSFVFLGAHADAFDQARSFGFSQGSSAIMSQDRDSYKRAYGAVSSAVAKSRSAGTKTSLGSNDFRSS